MKYCNNCGKPIEKTTDNSSSSYTCLTCQCWQAKELMEPKFKVGDWVILEGCGDKMKLRILGIKEDTCTAGKQIYYECRMFVKQESYRKEDANTWYPASRKDGLEIIRYNEIELIPYTEKG